jgi:hypothetical protein
MTLYYFMMRAWILIGDSEFMLRLPSMVFGVLTVLAIYVVAARLFSQLTGLIAATLLSVHGFHVAFSQIARSYSLLLFLLLLTMYLLVSAMESQSTRDWAFRLRYVFTLTSLRSWSWRPSRFPLSSPIRSRSNARKSFSSPFCLNISLPPWLCLYCFTTRTSSTFKLRRGPT